MDLDELLELEHRGWRALCASEGADFYGSLMTEDALMVVAGGQLLDRAAVMASLNDAPPWQSYAIEDERLVELGDDAAALVYTGRANREGEPPFVALMTSVYTRGEGGWRLALYQQTPVA